MVKSQTTSITPAQHAARHAIGGADPLVNPLLLHGSRHEIGGDDVFNGIVQDGSAVAVLTNTSSVGAYTDIDCSAVCGAAIHTLFLRIFGHANCYFAFRENGSAVDPYSADNAHFIGIDKTCYAMITTDAAGIIEWQSNNNITVYVDSWW